MNLLVSCIAVVVVVAIHDLVLVRTNRWVARLPYGALRPAICVLAALIAHHVEVAVFALGWQVLLSTGNVTLEPAVSGFFEVMYFSGAVYTSLGFGDIVPTGPGRLYAVTEAISGLVLIAWTASYTFLQMQRHWDEES